MTALEIAGMSESQREDLASEIGDAIARAWNAPAREAEALPPIDLIGSERDYLGRAVVALLSKDNSDANG